MNKILLILILFIGHGAMAQQYVFDSTFQTDFPFYISRLQGIIDKNDSICYAFGDVNEGTVSGPFIPITIIKFNKETFKYDTSFNCAKPYCSTGPTNQVLFNKLNDSIYLFNDGMCKISDQSVYDSNFGYNLYSNNPLQNIAPRPPMCYIPEINKLLGAPNSAYKVTNSDTVRPGGFIMFRINADGTFDRNYTHDVNSEVSRIIRDEKDSTYLISGYFTQYDHQNSHKIVRIDPHGNAVNRSYLFHQNAYVRILDTDPDGKVWVTGRLIFKHYPSDTFCLVRMNHDLTLDTTFNHWLFKSSFGIPSIQDIIQVGSKYIVGGYFNEVQGKAVENLVVIGKDGKMVEGHFTGNFIPYPFMDVLHAVNDLIQMDDYIYACGDFYGYAGHKLGPLIRFKIVADSIPQAEETPHFIFTIYPNPATNMLNIVLDDPSQNNLLEIVNVTGKTIFKKTLEKDEHIQQLSISNLAAGAYFVKLNQQVLKFIKQ